MNSKLKHLYDTFGKALIYYAEIERSERRQTNITFYVSDDNKFWALAELENEKLNIQISTGVFDNIQSLWAAFLKDNKDELPSTFNRENLVHGSLIWLFLHELSHYTLGHFEITGKHSISETTKGREFSLLSRAPSTASPIAGLEHLDYVQIERCLELQADHDAIEMLLEAYSTDAWDELRTRAACISAVMVLIDVADKENGMKHSSHPKAATRIFQLLGHLSEMTLITAQVAAIKNDCPVRDEDIPSPEEQKAFSKQVVIPAFYDAIALAKAAGANHILNDLGDLPAFFQDILLAKTNSQDGLDQFKTEGAKEWAELVEVNEDILKALADYNND